MPNPGESIYINYYLTGTAYESIVLDNNLEKFPLPQAILSCTTDELPRILFTPDIFKSTVLTVRY